MTLPYVYYIYIYICGTNESKFEVDKQGKIEFTVIDRTHVLNEMKIP